MQRLARRAILAGVGQASFVGRNPKVNYALPARRHKIARLLALALEGESDNASYQPPRSTSYE
jgi:hypothetical protein